MLNLKKIRQAKGLAQKEVAAFIGVTQTAVSDWERGEREPDFETIVKLADYFNVTVDYLLGRTNVPGKRTLTNGDFADGYTDELSPFEKLEDELRYAISRLKDPLSKEFAPEIRQAIEIESEHIRNAHDLEFQYTPADIIQLCREVDNAEFIREIIEMLELVGRSTRFTQHINDDEALEYLEELHKRPEMRILFDVSRKASKKDIEAAVAIIEALKKQSRNEE